MDERKKNRREFLKESVLYVGAFFAGCKKKIKHTSYERSLFSVLEKSRVVISKSEHLRDNGNKLLSGKVLDTLDKAMNSLTESDTPKKAWLKIVSPDDRVSLKINCLAGKGISTNKELVDAIIFRLLESGIRKENIIVWDRLNDDLIRAGYEIVTDRNKTRFIGNDHAGYSNDFHSFGEVGSMISNIVTEFSTIIINLPVLKDHGIVGVSGAMKNLFGAIHNPNKYHMNIGNPYVADVSAIPVLREKVQLTICDAFTMQYDGGPPFKPQSTIEYDSILVSKDMVALDYTGWKIIEEKRKNNNLNTLKEAGREPVYIFTAGDENHNLGNVKEEMIEVVRC